MNRSSLALLLLPLLFGACATAPRPLTLEERAICKDFTLDCSSGFPGLSDEDRVMWESGAMHQPQCTMAQDGQMSCV